MKVNNRLKKNDKKDWENNTAKKFIFYLYKLIFTSCINYLYK